MSILYNRQNRGGSLQMSSVGLCVCPEFDRGAGLSSLREQFSESLCSQWLSSAPHKPFQLLTPTLITAARSQRIKGFYETMCFYNLQYRAVMGLNFMAMNIENMVWFGFVLHLPTSNSQ